MPGTMRWRGLRSLWPLALVLVFTVMGCAMANQQTVALEGDGPWQRFIVKFSGDSAPGRDAAAVQSRLDAAAKAIGANDAVTVQWQRRMGVGADVVVASEPLDRAHAQRLLERLEADPDVEYAEVDGMMGIGPVPEPKTR